MFVPINHTPSFRRNTSYASSYAAPGRVSALTPRLNPRPTASFTAPLNPLGALGAFPGQNLFPLHAPPTPTSILTIPTTAPTLESHIPPWYVKISRHCDKTGHSGVYRVDFSKTRTVTSADEDQASLRELLVEKGQVFDEAFGKCLIEQDWVEDKKPVDSEAFESQSSFGVQTFESGDVEAQPLENEDLDRMSNMALFAHTWSSIVFPMVFGVLVLFLDTFGGHVAAMIVCLAVASITLCIATILIILESRHKEEGVSVRHYFDAATRNRMTHQDRSKLKRRVIAIGGGLVLVALCVSNIVIKGWQIAILVQTQQASSDLETSSRVPPLPLLTSPAVGAYSSVSAVNSSPSTSSHQDDDSRLVDTYL